MIFHEILYILIVGAVLGAWSVVGIAPQIEKAVNDWRCTDSTDEVILFRRAFLNFLFQ
jgi:hypothetical protein